jgi:hypothetical protein
MFVGDVEDSRPTKIEVAIAGKIQEYINILGDDDSGQSREYRDGNEWDTVMLPVTIPAGVGELTVQAFSYDDNSGKLPASLVWVASAICLEKKEEKKGKDGCTPGYWKNHLHSWQDLSPDDEIQSVFKEAKDYNNLASKSLLDALKFGGGPGTEGAAKNLLRIAKAALLNALHSDVDYILGSDEIVDLVNEALKSEDRHEILSLKDDLDMYNNAYCPLN